MFPTSLGSLFQGHIVSVLEKIFLMSKLNLSRHSLWLVLFVIKEFGFVIFVTIFQTPIGHYLMSPNFSSLPH